MSVTQNYTINTSSEVWEHIGTAVIGRLEDKMRVVGLTDRPLPDFLMNEIARGVEAMVVLNAATVLTREDTHGALEGEMLDLVRQLLRNEIVELREQDRGFRSSKISCDVVAAKIERVNAALLFLESPK